jgi:hypothetical protein
MIHPKQVTVPVNQTDADGRMVIDGWEIVIWVVRRLDHPFGGCDSHIQPILLGLRVLAAFAKWRVRPLLGRFGSSHVGPIF